MQPPDTHQRLAFGNIRYRPRQGKSAYVHTLNASGLATSRLVPALLEQHQ
ncbi:hypothetical protein [Streptomyces sp. PSKA30]|nr:hypothetical protein [Streptomyces sp. PSKA30]MBZ9642207.1 hypothetical protein [Streptomyces sp. PSKA30]